MNRVSAALLLLMATTTCGQTPDQTHASESREPTMKVDSVRLAAMKTEILALIDEPRCSQASDCASIAFGSKPCGGPWAYLVYSITDTDVSALQARVNEYNEFNSAVNERHGVVSDCMLVTEPRVDCVNGLCVVPSKSP